MLLMLFCMVIPRSQKAARIRFTLLNEVRAIQRKSRANGPSASPEEMARKRKVIKEQKRIATQASSHPADIFDAEYRTHYRGMHREYQRAIQIAHAFQSDISRAQQYRDYRSNSRKLHEALVSEFGQRKGREFLRMLRQEFSELHHHHSVRSKYFDDAEQTLIFFRKNKKVFHSIVQRLHIKKRNWDNLFDDITADVVNRLMHYDPSRGKKLNSFLYSSIANALTDYLRVMGDYSRADKAAVEAGKMEKLPTRQSDSNLNAQSERGVRRVFSIIDKSSSSRLARRMDRDEVQTALRLLPENQRELIEWRYGSDISISEIALLTGKGERYTHRLLAAALSRLREWYVNRRE